MAANNREVSDKGLSEPLIKHLEEQNGTLMVAIPFDMLFDVEMGLVNVIRFHYTRRMFLTEQAEDEAFMKVCLRDRLEKNPLTVMIYDRSSVSDDEINEMYVQFMEREYPRIIPLSPPTALWKMIQFIQQMRYDKVRFTVVYANDIEAELLKKFNYNGDLHKGKILDKEILNKCSVIYVKDVSVLYTVPEIHRKHVYIANYSHNMIEVEEGNFVPDILEEYSERFSSSEFVVVNMYSDNDLQMADDPI